MRLKVIAGSRVVDIENLLLFAVERSEACSSIQSRSNTTRKSSVNIERIFLVSTCRLKSTNEISKFLFYSSECEFEYLKVGWKY